MYLKAYSKMVNLLPDLATLKETDVVHQHLQGCQGDLERGGLEKKMKLHHP